MEATTVPSLVSIQVGRVRTLGTPGATDPADKPWESAIFKAPVSGPIRVGPLGLEGDAQADRSCHGGLDMALLAYSAEWYPLWRSDTAFASAGEGEPSFGGFGENLTVAGLDERTVCLGDRWRIGEVELEVSQPRRPCWKLGRRWRIKELPALVERNGRSGWYFRVRREGIVEAGTDLELLARPYPAYTIGKVAEIRSRRREDRASALALAACPALSASWREELSA